MMSSHSILRGFLKIIVVFKLYKYLSVYNTWIQLVKATDSEKNTSEGVLKSRHFLGLYDKAICCYDKALELDLHG